jgi:hypothetical protein
VRGSRHSRRHRRGSSKRRNIRSGLKIAGKSMRRRKGKIRRDAACRSAAIQLKLSPANRESRG